MAFAEVANGNGGNAIDGHDQAGASAGERAKLAPVN